MSHALIITKDVTNKFRLKKTNETAIKDIKNVYRVKKRKWSNQRQNN